MCALHSPTLASKTNCADYRIRPVKLVDDLLKDYKMITDYDIEQKAEELLAERIADDSYFGDAVTDCYAELRALLNATNLDDKLSALDSFKSMLVKHIARPDVLNQEAYDFLKAQEAMSDDYDERRYA